MEQRNEQYLKEVWDNLLQYLSDNQLVDGVIIKNFFRPCFLYAITDEFHQGITPGRTPLIQDVFIDALGAVFGVGLGTLKKIK